MSYPSNMHETCHHCGHDIEGLAVGQPCRYCGREVPSDGYLVRMERTLPLNRLGQRKPLPDAQIRS